MVYSEKNYTNLLGISGFSDSLLNNHFSLYKGYVANTNKLIDKLDVLEFGTPEHAETQRRLGWEWNGMRMHELYFDGLTPNPTNLPENSRLSLKLNEIYDNLAWPVSFSYGRGIQQPALELWAKDAEANYNSAQKALLERALANGRAVK